MAVCPDGRTLVSHAACRIWMGQSWLRAVDFFVRKGEGEALDLCYNQSQILICWSPELCQWQSNGLARPVSPGHHGYLRVLWMGPGF